MVAINVAVLTIVFSMMPNEAKALPDYQWDADLVECSTYPKTYSQTCKEGNKLLICENFTCLQFLPEVEVR
ncbi:MAG: hypothetical protein GX587_00945 [Bacteroidales bacterium]|nr:hypothetical protein [Bacteroidales bacterium]